MGIFVQKLFETNLNSRYQRVKKSEKNKGTRVISILKVDIKSVSNFFFLIFHSLVPKYEICLKYILDKNSIKQPQCVVGYSHRQSKSESKGEQHVRSILWPLSAEKALQKNDLAAKSTAWEQNTARPQLSYEL